MVKVMLHLSIDPELVSIAKSSGLNLSSEFEQWLKIRMNKIEDEKPILDIDIEKAKHRAELARLESIQKLEKDNEMKLKEEMMVIDNMIDNMIEVEMNMEINCGKSLLEIIDDSKINGIQFLFKRKFNKIINPIQARELLENRIKERGL